VECGEGVDKGVVQRHAGQLQQGDLGQCHGAVDPVEDLGGLGLLGDQLGKDRAQLRLRDRRLGENDRLAPAVRGRDLLDRKRIAHRVVDVALAHGAHHAVYIQCDLIHGIPP